MLESAHIKRTSVATDVLGVSGWAMLGALMPGQASPTEMAELAKGRLRETREPLAKAREGQVQAHHRVVLTELWGQIDHLDEPIARFDAQIEASCALFEESVVLLETIPGVARQTAEIMVAEMGTGMSRFPTANHLAAWAGVALNQSAHAASRTKHT